jgi:hypothetical protein
MALMAWIGRISVNRERGNLEEKNERDSFRTMHLYEIPQIQKPQNTKSISQQRFPTQT